MLPRPGMARDDGAGAVLRWLASRVRQLEAHKKKLEASFASAESARPAVLPAEKAFLWNPGAAPFVSAGSGVGFADEWLAPSLRASSRWQRKRLPRNRPSSQCSLTATTSRCGL